MVLYKFILDTVTDHYIPLHFVLLIQFVKSVDIGLGSTTKLGLFVTIQQTATFLRPLTLNCGHWENIDWARGFYWDRGSFKCHVAQ